MTRVILFLFVLLVLASCVSGRDPIQVAPVREAFCDSEKLNPERYRNLKENQAVRAADYYEVRDASLLCANNLLTAAVANQRIAEFNQQQVSAARVDGRKWGAILVLVLEILIWVALA
jgi:hypothetical protein